MLGKLPHREDVASNRFGRVVSTREFVNSLIANDKFCFSRYHRVRLARKRYSQSRLSPPSAPVSSSRETILPRRGRQAAPGENQTAGDGPARRSSSLGSGVSAPADPSAVSVTERKQQIQ